MTTRRATLIPMTRTALAASLCCLMAVPQALLAEDPAMTPTAAKPVRTAPLTSQEKTLHALNRLTFGPRPGDEAAVSKLGLEAWFQQQLHPSSIDDSALDARLQAFPAMKLSQQQLLHDFPSPQMLRQISTRGGGFPSDPALHAVYADAAANYDKLLKNQGANPNQQAGQNNQAGSNDMQANDMQSMAADKPADSQSMDANSMATSAKGKGKKANAEPMDRSSVQAILALAPDQRFARLLAMNPTEMQSFRASLRAYERLTLTQGMTPAQMETVAATQAPVRVVGAEALESRLLRDVYSDRQLQAVMADFWLNHFSVYARKNQNEPYYLPAYERDVILPNALGKFENLLVATAQSPAMLMYLDNWESVGPDSPAAKYAGAVQKARPDGQLAQRLPKGINENYARELMELHTLGVNGGYTQNDVIEVAKCFTGWTIDKPYQGNGGGALFEENRHQLGSKTVLGQTIPEGGQQEGLTVLHRLATSPQTAKFISTKLAVRFVSDDPPASLVDKMSATFLKSGGDIKAVLTTMFHAPEFWAPDVYRAKVKTPIEFMASALRASDADVRNALPLVQAMDRLGMPIYGMQTPNGYSWKQTDWVSSNALIGRMNFALVLSGDRVPGTQTDWATRVGIASGTAPTPGTEARLETLILGEPAMPRTRSAVLDQANNPTAQRTAEQNFNARPTTDADTGDMLGGNVLRKNGGKGGRQQADYNSAQPETPLDTMAGLLLGSPDFQRR